MVGLGISTLFSSGIIWLKENMELTSQITSLFLIATTFGGPAFTVYGTSMRGGFSSVAYYRPGMAGGNVDATGGARQHAPALAARRVPRTTA